MTDKVGTKYAQNARFVGRKAVTGPLNDQGLAHLVADLQTGDPLRGSGPNIAKQNSGNLEELRCNLEFSDRHLLITYIKKDEGFESDGESTKSNEAVKIVFNDDTSSANSSASSSDSDQDLTNAGSSNSGSKSTPSSSASASPTADLAKYKFDHKESYNINDVVICHTASNNVVWVIRSPNKSDLEAIVIECSNEDDVKHLYKKFLDVSKRSKLERHRRRKSDGGSVVARSMEAIFKRDKSSDRSDPEPDRSLRYSLVQHTDRNGITHIEVEQPKSLMLGSTTSSTAAQSAVSAMPDQKMGPSQQLVAKLRSSRSSAASKKPASEKSKFAKELESILSKEIESRKVLTHQSHRPPGESLSLRQRAPALLLKKLDEFEEKANAMWAKAEAAQAAEENNKKVWNKPTVVIDPSKMASRTPPPRSKIDNQRKERLSRIKADLLRENVPSFNQSGMTNVSNISSKAPVSLGPTLSADAVSAVASKKSADVSANTAGQSAAATGSDGSNAKAQILVPTKTGKEPVKKLYPKDQAIPELMPRAPVPNPGAPRFILALPSPMQFQAGHPQGLPHHGQPHSLPFYPVMAAPHPHWGRFPAGHQVTGHPGHHQSGDFNDTNNNMGHHVWAAVPMQRPVPPNLQPQQLQQQASADNNSRGRSRDRSKQGGGIDPDQRRRAQSKSPAGLRVNQANHALLRDNQHENNHNKNHDLSGGLTRKFREFGDAFRQKISRGKNTANVSSVMAANNHNSNANGADTVDGVGSPAKSNLKKKAENENNSALASANNLHHSSDQTNNDKKKVQFNKFATVQMMEI